MYINFFRTNCQSGAQKHRFYRTEKQTIKDEISIRICLHYSGNRVDLTIQKSSKIYPNELFFSSYIAYMHKKPIQISG